MKTAFTALVLCFAAPAAWAQSAVPIHSTPEHRIVFQHTTGYTTASKALMKQLGNMLSVSPTSQIEIVCHGPGLDMLVQSKSRIAAKIAEFSAKGVVFNACQFSMRERSVTPDQLLPQVQQVPAGIIYIVSKQELGFNYIKSGF